mgnify:CR=1 FL=1
MARRGVIAHRAADALAQRVDTRIAGVKTVFVVLCGQRAVEQRHGDHDQDHTPSLTALLEGIDHLWEQIELRGMQDKVTIVIGSDFGRTPFYNEGDGKDHWNITSIMAMGAGITGNRIIGATDENFEALKLNASTLQPDDNGIIVTPQHVHRSLRDFLGVQDDLDNLFPIGVEKLDLFS